MRTVRWTLAWSIFGLALVLYALLVGAAWFESKHSLSSLSASTLGVLVPASLFSVANFLLRGLRFQTLISSQTSAVSPVRSQIVFLSALSLSATPARLGDLVRVGMMRRWYGVPVRTSLPVCVFDRVFDLFAVALLAAVSVVFVPALSSSYPAWWIVSVLALGLAIVCYLAYAAISSFGARMPRSIRRFVTLVKFRRPIGHRFPMALGLSVLAWGCEGVAVALILDSLGGGFDLMTALFVHSVALLGGALTFLPGGIGGAEAALVFLLAQLDWSLETAIAAAVLIRMATFWLAIGFGAVVWGAAVVWHRRSDGVGRMWAR